MGAKTTLLSIYNPAMLASGQPFYGNLPAGQLAAAASWTTSVATITMAEAVPSWVVAGMNVWDVTTASNMGAVSASTSTTLTLSADMSAVSHGAADVLQFGFTPADFSVGYAAGADIQGLVEIAQLHCAEATAILTYLKTDVILTGTDSPNTTWTAIGTAITSLS